MSPLATSADAAAAGLRRDTLGGALLLGALLGRVWSPCSGPLLGSTLALLAQSAGDAGGSAGPAATLHGALVLGLFGLGAALPLVAAAYASRAGFARWRSGVLRHASRAKRVFGVLLLLLGAAILGGGDRWLETQINQHLPDAWLALTTRW
jgi:cytochrome c biogenesis protein CcdA